ncbi:MAG: hypothetical protein JST31_04055 [Actinobacteria bacterium]|nr:hypothetical protein [Actinomycetota bacterium]
MGICALVLLLVGAGSAAALRLAVGNLVVVTDGGFTPTTLPKQHYAPIKLHGYGRISTTDGKTPPILETITLWFDKHGEVDTKGLPICTPGKLAATTPAVARRNCRGAIVGTGYGTAVVNFPEQKPFYASSPITIFNGPPRHGNPTVLAHAYLSVPAPTTYVVPIEIRRVHDGRYGFKTEAKIPKIAGGFGTPLYGRLQIGREWTYQGKRLSYANASCPDGRLQGKGEFKFKGGASLTGTLVKPCTGR